MEQSQNSNNLAALPMMANKVNPTPGPDALSITGLTRKSGKITGYQLSDGRRVSRAEGVQLAKNNGIKGVAVAEKKGTEYLRALPDGNEANNLSSLPTVRD